MAFTLVGYYANVDTGGALAYLDPIPDPHVRVEGKNIIVPRGLNYVAAAYAYGPNTIQARIDTPSLRRLTLWDVAPINNALLPNWPVRLDARLDSPVELAEDEGMRFAAAENAAGAAAMGGFLWLSDGAITPATGEIFTVQASAESVSGSYQWVNAALTFSQTLPVGRYALVGAMVYATGLIAARFVFVGYTWRPGLLADPDNTTLVAEAFRRGKWGVWGEFDHTQPPTVDLFSTAATTQANLYLDLIKTA